MASFIQRVYLFYVFRALFYLPSETSSYYSFNLFVCSSLVPSFTDVTLYLLDTLVFVCGFCVALQLVLYHDVLGYTVQVPSHLGNMVV